MATASAVIDARNIIDAEYETLVPLAAPEVRPPAPTRAIAGASPPESLSILRGDDPDAVRGDQPDQLTPSFLLFTALAAFAVFWVCGGRFLLY